MKLLKQIILKIVLPLFMIASVITGAWLINDDYHQNKVEAYQKTDKSVIAKNVKRYTNFAFSKGKLTIDNATTQVNMNENQYNIRGFSNGNPVSVNISTKPQIKNHKITLYRLTSTSDVYWQTTDDVHKNAFIKAKTDQELKTYQTRFNNDFTQLIVRFVIIIASIILVFFWFGALVGAI